MENSQSGPAVSGVVVTTFHVRRLALPAESPTLGLTHLQFEALLTNAKHSTNPCGLALVTMLGLLGLRIFEATGSDIEDLGEEHGHRVRHCATRRLRRLAEEAGVKLPRMRIRTCSGTPSSPRCLTPESTYATCRSPPATRTRAPPCATTEPRKNFDRRS